MGRLCDGVSRPISRGGNDVTAKPATTSRMIHLQGATLVLARLPDGGVALEIKHGGTPMMIALTPEMVAEMHAATAPKPGGQP